MWSSLQTPEASRGEMDLTFCEESSTITLQYAVQPASQQSFSMCIGHAEDQTVTQALENHSSHCCKLERNGKVYQPLPNGSWQLQLDTWHCSLVLLKSAKAGSQHHQDWAQGLNLLKGTSGLSLSFPFLSSSFMSLSFPLLQANQETFKVARNHIFCLSAKPGWIPHVLPDPHRLSGPTVIWCRPAHCADGSTPLCKPQLQSTSFGVGNACHHVQAGTNSLGSLSPSPSQP